MYSASSSAQACVNWEFTLIGCFKFLINLNPLSKRLLINKNTIAFYPVERIRCLTITQIVQMLDKICTLTNKPISYADREKISLSMDAILGNTETELH